MLTGLAVSLSQIIRTYSHGKADGVADFVACSVSSSGRYLYAVAEDAVLYVFNVETASVDHALKVCIVSTQLPGCIFLR